MAKEFLKVRSGVGLKPNTAPSDPDNGDYYYDSGTNEFKFRQASTWVGLGSGGAGVTPIWTKITLSHTAFQTAATTNDIELFNLVIRGMIHQVVLKHSASFVGTGITAYSFKVGTASNFGKYVSSFNVLQAPGDAVRSITQADDIESFTGTTSIRIQATSVGANLSASTAGSVDLWVLVSALP